MACKGAEGKGRSNKNKFYAILSAAIISFTIGIGEVTWGQGSSGEFFRTSGDRPRTGQIIAETIEGHNFRFCDETTGIVKISELEKSAGCEPGHGTFTLYNLEEFLASVEAASLEDFRGESIYDANGESIASISDIIITDDGEAESVVIDVGGFLGIGSRQIAVGIDELSVLKQQGSGDYSVYMDTTQEQLEVLPEYEG